jgi:hypothetical protein
MDKILAALVLALVTFGASAQVYRWTDERGVVNYSNTRPPAGVPTVRVPEPELPVLATPPAEAPAARTETRPPPRDGEAELRQRVDTLERELAAERGARQQIAQADDERRQRAREECERQRRVDCDQLEVLPDGAPVIVHPRVRPRPNIVPTLPVPERKAPVASAPFVRKDGNAGKMAPGTKGL